MKYLFWYKIVVYTRVGNGNIIDAKVWEDLRFEIRTKYNWYFKYRAALFQVKYPKYYIETKWGRTEITNESKAEHIEAMKKRQRTTLKRKITQFKNAIETYEYEQKLNLIPNFENPKYMRTVEKLSEYEKELKKIILPSPTHFGP